MKNIAIISEYNPFHKGHLYQINEIKKIYSNSRIISIMSGNFVQRGEPAILNKYERCKNAILSGVDLVLQIPTIYSLQSAENFALGSIKILRELKIIDFLSFGIESSDFNSLYKIAEVQYKNEKVLREEISIIMNKGFSFPKAFEMATNKFLDLDIKDCFLSNNILALEYIKSTFKTKYNLNFLPILRQGSNHLVDKVEKNKQPSASAIRESIYNDKLDTISNYLPDSSFQSLKGLGKKPDYYDLIKYVFLIENMDFTTITGYEEGIDNLILKNLKISKSYDEFLEKSKSKRYKESRLKRYLLNCLLHVTKNFVDESIDKRPTFVNILGFNERGLSIIKEISQYSNIELIVNKRDFKLTDANSIELFKLEEKATDLYNIISKELKSEYQYMPVIKKEDS